MLELGALAIAYEFWLLVDEPGTHVPRIAFE